MASPDMLLLFSGKRKSGKDYLTEKLAKILGPERCEILRISEPIKRFWAEKNGLSLSELLSDGPFKENYRAEMIKWSDEQRAKDSGIFCRDAMSKSTKPICIISDIRRKTDIKFFQSEYPNKVVLIRIESDETVRQNRGWVFQAGVDDIQSECDLDDFKQWDYEITNNGDVESDVLLKEILERISS